MKETVGTETDLAPRLAPPGAGIPFFQKMILRYFIFPRYSKKMTLETAQDFFKREGEKILAKARELPAEKITEKVLVKPMPGLEDSSRYWSVSMAMEHLIIVGSQIAGGIVDLGLGKFPQKKADTATVKPFENKSAEKIISEFEAFIKTFLEKTTRDVVNREAPQTFAHPWFGPLNAKKWMALAAIHQQIHRKQIQAIIEGLSLVH